MPNKTHYKYRIWCKKCMDFTLHERVYKDEFEHEKFSLCNFENGEDFNSFCDCGCRYTDVSIDEIGVSKVEIQRNKYKAQRRREFSNIYSGAMLGTLFNPSFGCGTTVIESDAGLEYEEKLNRQEFEKQKEIAKAELSKFKNVGRNDTCLCGSNVKYKKCCLQKNTLIAEAFGFR